MFFGCFFDVLKLVIYRFSIFVWWYLLLIISNNNLFKKKIDLIWLMW